MDPHVRDKARFYLLQVTAALSPSNFVGTNPELLRMTLQESGENLVRGLKMMAEDIQAGKGNLRIRQSDARAFKLGVNMAITPGKVIFRNELIELIQYEPSTPEVYRRPLLIVPPWINKFYILDLNPEKSFIRWAVAQGLTVFVISWVNPDERLADKGFEAYMREGILAALDCVEQATGERAVTAIGYCVGGTLLAATLAYMAAVGDDRVKSATFFTTQIDFTDAGDLKVFVDAEQLREVEEKMVEHGYLEGSSMAQAFNMLRPSDLIWSYYVNNYLKGKEPMPFDLLAWNSDSTRMPAANHKFYLRHCYLQNDLSNGRIVLGGKILDLKKVTIPIYELASKEDHIAPARSVFTGAKCFGGLVRYVMAGSGHIAGVVNPPAKPKYQFLSGGPPKDDFESWVATAKETPGSWWPDWAQWVTSQAPEKVPSRKPGEGKLKALCDAPGSSCLRRSRGREGRRGIRPRSLGRRRFRGRGIRSAGGNAAAQRAPGSAKRPRRRQGRGTHAASFDHLVGAGEQHLGNLDAERLRGLEVDGELDRGRLLDRQVAGFRAFEDAVYVARGAAPELEGIGRVGHEAALTDGCADPVDRRHAALGSARDNARNERFAAGFAGHDEPVETFARDRLEARLEIGAIHVQLRQRDVKTRRGFIQSSLFLSGSPGEIAQEGDAIEVRDSRLQELEPFRAEFGRQQRQARDVAPRPGEFRSKTDADEIPRNADNRNRGGQRMRLDQREVPRHQHVDPERQKVCDKVTRSRRVSLRVALLQKKGAAEDVSAFLEPLA